MENFTFQGPLGPIECIVEPNRSAKKAVLIMAHGFRGSRDSGGRAQGVAQQAAVHCNVVRFNFTGTKIISRQVEEILAVVHEVHKRETESRIYLLGRSMGGAASIIAASCEPQIERLILWATPNNMRKTFVHVMGKEHYQQLNSGKTLHFTDERGECALTPDFLTDFDKYSISDILSCWDERPVLILHCETDEIVLVEQAKRNSELLGDKSELHIFPAGDHSFTEHSEEAGALLADWLGRKDAAL